MNVKFVGKHFIIAVILNSIIVNTQENKLMNATYDENCSPEMNISHDTVRHTVTKCLR